MTSTAEDAGLLVGKFHPPHAGHVALLAHTMARSPGGVDVLVCERPDQVVPGADRARWLADAVGDAAPLRFVVTPDDLPDAPGPWADRVRRVRDGRPLHHVAVQDVYGPAFADALGVALVRLPDDAATAAVSATRVRGALRDDWALLVPAARAALARRIVLVGAESTGKTTLAAALAASLRTAWVPEFGRTYWAEREDTAPATEEFLAIAREQSWLEDRAAAGSVAPWVVCDTDALVTAVWHERYLGHTDAALLGLAQRRRPDLYVLCGDDVPWQQDGTRESRAHRAAMQARTRELVAASGVPWLEVRGGLAARVATVTEAVAAHCPVPDLDGSPDSLSLRRPAHDTWPEQRSAGRRPATHRFVRHDPVTDHLHALDEETP